MEQVWPGQGEREYKGEADQLKPIALWVGFRGGLYFKIKPAGVLLSDGWVMSFISGHCNYYIPFLVTIVNIAVGLNYLLHRINSVHDRFYFTFFNQLIQEH